MKRDGQSLDEIAARLNEENMLVLSQTAKLISTLSAEHQTSVSELTWGILRDPLLTARVLRLANGIYYRRESRQVRTISRAILQIGFDAIRGICISAALIENFLQGPRKDRVIREMLKSFHAAVHARSLAARRKDPAVEEVFIAALLFRIGPLAFWSFGGGQADRLDERIKQCPEEPVEKIEQEVLGFKLQDLTGKLIKDWGLGGVLARVVGGDRSDPRAHSIVLGYKLTDVVSEEGWGSPGVGKVVYAIGDFLGMSTKDVNKLIRENTDEATQMAKDYGLEYYARLLAQPPYVDASKGGGEAEGDQPFSLPDPVLQLKLLTELSALKTDQSFNINMFLSTLLEGISRGIGMDRALFSVIEKRQVVGRYGVGWDPRDVERFVCGVDTPMPTIFNHVAEKRAPVWVDGKRGGMGRYLTREVRAVMPTSHFFIMPLIVNSIVIGLILADRYLSGRALDEASFNSFQFFNQTANAILLSAFPGAPPSRP
jgi:HD-like signal output (HDOD) protein